MELAEILSEESSIEVDTTPTRYTLNVAPCWQLTMTLEVPSYLSYESQVAGDYYLARRVGGAEIYCGKLG